MPEPLAFPAGRSRECTWLGSVYHQGYETGTSHRLGLPAPYRVKNGTEATFWIIPSPAVGKTVSEVVQELRDRIKSQTRLTRQEIALAIGVDRRSLSGFVSGEIRPTPDRLIMLQALAEVADWAAAQFGEHAREVFRGESPDTSPLRLIAKGRTDIRRELWAVATRLGLRERYKVRQLQSRQSLSEKAALVWATQDNVPIERGTVRDGSQYEQDLSKAVPTEQTKNLPRRRHL